MGPVMCEYTFLYTEAAPWGQVEEATNWLFGFFGFCPVPLPLPPFGSSTLLPLPLWGGTASAVSLASG